MVLVAKNRMLHLPQIQLGQSKKNKIMLEMQHHGIIT